MDKVCASSLPDTSASIIWRRAVTSSAISQTYPAGAIVAGDRHHRDAHRHAHAGTRGPIISYTWARRARGKSASRARISVREGAGTVAMRGHRRQFLVR